MTPASMDKEAVANDPVRGRGLESSRVSLVGITHRYGSQVVLSDVSLEIGGGEFLTILGPSGCGKTTLLRIIGGFVRPEAGTVVIEGRDVTNVRANKRPVHTVFQRPMLFPHLDVAGNVEFGLKLQRVQESERAKRVKETLTLVRLDGFEQRRSNQLSGGQMQRVALARALVNQPRVLLLDEPLSALDLKIRLEMEAELRRLHRVTRATFVYVTHDQREAMALSDTVVVMNNGRPEQVGSPAALYRRPSTPFTARFVGDANLIPGTVVAQKPHTTDVEVAGVRVPVRCGSPVGVGEPVWVVLRPQVVRLVSPSARDSSGLRGIVRDAAFRGTGFSCRVEVAGVPKLIKAEVVGDEEPLIDTEVGLAWLDDAGSLLPRPSEDPG